MGAGSMEAGRRIPAVDHQRQYGIRGRILPGSTGAVHPTSSPLPGSVSGPLSPTTPPVCNGPETRRHRAAATAPKGRSKPAASHGSCPGHHLARRCGQ